MRISDAERRGIVESLRLEADDWRSYRSYEDTFSMPDSDFTASILVAFGFDDTAVPVYELFDKLADLVDRPTCQNKQIVYNRTAPKEFRTDNLICSACGEIFCADGDGVNHPIDWAFCPNCGAEVVE